jgi:phage tail sheath protein FI
MAEYLHPGIFVEEFDSGAVPIAGAGTSTAGFIGLAERGPVGGEPKLVTNFADFKRSYGGYLGDGDFAEYRWLAYSVEQFFAQGGTRAFIGRVAPSDATWAQSQEESPITFYARSVGTWGNGINLSVAPSSKAKTQIYELISPTQVRVKSAAGFVAGDVIALTDGDATKYNRITNIQDNVFDLSGEFDESVVDTEIVATKILSVCNINIALSYGGVDEAYDNVSLNSASSDYLPKRMGRSKLVSLEVGELPTDATSPYAALVGAGSADSSSFVFHFANGTDGTADSLTPADFIGTDDGPGKRTGIQAFLDNSLVSIITVPGVTDPNVALKLVEHCENTKSRFAVLDFPKELSSVEELRRYRDMFDTSYAALYHPWLQAFDPLDKKDVFLPPSGAVMGIYARSDATRNVGKSPANEQVNGVTGLSVAYNDAEQDLLNPVGINLIRSLPGAGIKVWGARTLSNNGLWMYVSVRRTFIFIEESIKQATAWVVFEPNTEGLWLRVQSTISNFLNTQWRNGVLAGASAAEAFFVRVGRDTMSQDDIDNGRLICEIGIAPVKPAEFVIFRFTQNTLSA